MDICFGISIMSISSVTMKATFKHWIIINKCGDFLWAIALWPWQPHAEDVSLKDMIKMKIWIATNKDLYLMLGYDDGVSIWEIVRWSLAIAGAHCGANTDFIWLMLTMVTMVTMMTMMRMMTMKKMKKMLRGEMVMIVTCVCRVSRCWCTIG